MASSKSRLVPFRRKRDGKTNYKKRLNLLKSKKPVLVIRSSLNNVYAQIVEFTPAGDKVLVSANTQELRKMGWNFHANISSFYLVGYLIAKKAAAKKVKTAIVDFGLRQAIPGSNLYATIKGAIDAGLNVPCDDSVLPKDDRVSGKHVAEYAAQLKSQKDLYAKQFSQYTKAKVDPEKLPELFEKFKGEISKVK